MYAAHSGGNTRACMAVHAKVLAIVLNMWHGILVQGKYKHW